MMIAVQTSFFRTDLMAHVIPDNLNQILSDSMTMIEGRLQTTLSNMSEQE